MAMTKEQLQERIDKALDKLAAAERRAEKNGKLMSEKVKELLDKYYKWGPDNTRVLFNHVEFSKYGVGAHIYAYREALNDIDSIKATIKKYETKIKEIENFENKEKIQVLVEFLDNWAKSAYNFYLENAELYCDLKIKQLEEEEKWLSSQTFNSKYEEYARLNNFRKKYYEDITSLSKSVVENAYRKEINTEKLAKIIEDEKTLKYQDFIARVTKVVGEITDVSALTIGNKQGELNGIVAGKDGRARVETIMAGGYDVQCLHYRVLVKKLK